MATSFKVGVLANGDTKPAYNGLRFATREAAEAYAVDLACRWTAVRDWIIEPSDDPVNR